MEMEIGIKKKKFKLLNLLNLILVPCSLISLNSTKYIPFVFTVRIRVLNKYTITYR